MRDPRYDCLFEPVQLGPVTAGNRFYQVPHCSGMGWKRPRMLAAMRGMKAEGGWGVVCTEYCSVHSTSDDGAHPFARLWDADDIRDNALMTEAVHAHGALAGVELWLGGNYIANLDTRVPPLGVISRPPTNLDVYHPVQSRRLDKRDIADIRRWQSDAAGRAVRLALMSLQGEMGYPSALSAKGWGYYDVLFKGRPFSFSQPYGSYVMENVLFKISFPAEFHAQTAVEAALELHGAVRNRLDDIERIDIETQEAGSRIIDKTGPLDNPADRDHCLQYMVAIPLIYGELTARHYEDEVAGDPRIDALRDRMEVRENPQFTVDYMDPEKRAIGNAVQVHFKDGSATERVEVPYPIGHRRRRREAVPPLEEKFERHLAARLSPGQCRTILDACASRDSLEPIRVGTFMDAWVVADD